MKTNLTKKLLLFAAALAFCITIFANPIDAEAALSTPTNFKQNTDRGDTDAITLTWDQVMNAERYYVSYSFDKITWSEEDSAGSSLTKYISGLQAGRTYYFRIRAYRDDYVNGSWVDTYSSYAYTTAYTAPLNVTKITQTAADASKKTVKVTWPKSTGATSYKVYTSSTLYYNVNYTKHYKNVTGTSVTIKNVSADSKFYVLVYPCNNGITYDYAYKYVTAAPSTPKLSEVQSHYVDDDGYWTELECTTKSGVYPDGYEFNVYYIKNGKAKTFKTFKTTSKYVKTDSATLFKYPFKYRVRSYYTIDNSKKVYSKWSSFKTYVPAAYPKKLKIVNSSKAKLTWTAVNGAKSYTVYYKTAKDASWKPIAKNVKGTSAVVKCKKGKYNYYYVRANSVKVSSSSRKNSSSASKKLDGGYYWWRSSYSNTLNKYHTFYY